MAEGTQVAVNTQSTLGEGTIWDYRRNCLFWVDIFEGLLHRLDPIKQVHETRKIGGYVGSVVPSTDGSLILLVDRKFVSYDWDKDEQHIIVEVEIDMPGNRFNDGKCDPYGRYWAGTMAIKEDEASGSLYCLEHPHSVTKKLEQLNISNGIVWTSDKKTMYYIDTPTMEVWGFDYDNESGAISNQRVAIQIPQSEGFPDGMTIDQEDRLWIAHWGGNQVGHWNPLTGKKLKSIPVPASHVTSCAFGGEKLDHLYISSARKGMSAEALKKEPLAGSLFVYDTQGAHQGVPANLYHNH